MLKFSGAALGLLCFTLTAFLLPFPMAAQSSFATITGTVSDPAGAAVPAANVEIRHMETGYIYRTQSNDAGQYTVANLRDGTFRVSARAAGFQEYVVDSILLTGRDVRRIDMILKVGTVETVVEVSAGVSLIETETARIADTKDRVVLRSLPLTLRRAWDYFTMTPQVERTSGWHIRLSGSRNNQSVAAIDGTPINDAGGGTGIGPLMDKTESLQELRIDMAQGSADQATMGQVTLISRAGTNELHGALSDYYSTPAFRARDPFQGTRSSVRAHIFTASVGGPIYLPKIYDGRNRSFFFFTYEGGFGSPNNTNFNNGVPLAAWREGDFSRISAPIRDPFAGGVPFPNNRVPAARINSVSKNLQETFYPLPNFGDPAAFTNNNYRDRRITNRRPNPTITNRFDHRFTDKAFVYARWTAVRWNLDGFDTAVPTVTELRPRSRDMDALTLAYTHTFSPSMMNEFRYGFTRQDFPQEAVVRGKDLVQKLGLQGLAPDLPDTGGIPRVSFVGLGITTLSVSDTCKPCSRHRIHNFTNNFNWYRGSHNWKIGYFAARAQFIERRESASLFGDTEYSNRFTGHPYADFLLGVPTTMRRAFPAIARDTPRWDHAFYVTDEWKVTPALTLTMGLRWDIHSPWREASGRMAIFDIASGKIVVPNGSRSLVSPLLPAGFVDVIEASQAGRPSSLVRTDWNNLAPRIGAAWRPFGPNTVFRAGFGFYYDTAPWQPSSGGAPFVLSEPPFTNPTDRPLVLPVVFPPGGVAGPSTFNLPNGIRPDIRIPLSMQYSATIEHQRWNTGFRASYTAANTRHGIYRYDVNQPAADGRLYVDKPRLFPQYPDILYADNGAGHQYHAFTFEVERRMSKGIHFQAFYTLARDIGDLERGEVPEDAFNRQRERAAWERLPTNRLSGNVIWELPFGHTRRWGAGSGKLLNAILGGWDISGIVAIEDGRFLTPLWRGPDPTGTRFTSGRNRPNVTLRPDHLLSADLANPTVERYFNVDAFAPPPVGRFGTSAKGVIRGAPVNVFHGSVAKHFYFGEKARLRVEMLGTNVFNHPNYQDPETRIDLAGAAGRITRVIDRNLKFDSAIPRDLQAQIRLEW